MKKFLVLGAVLFFPLKVFAATASPLEGFENGLLQSLLSHNHLFMALAVGIWAGRSASRLSLTFFPLAFLFGLFLGSAGGIFGLTLPFPEMEIFFSLALLGIGIFSSLRLYVADGAALLVLCGIIHGNPFGAGIMSMQMPFSALAGFFFSSLCLLAIGILTTLALERILSERRSSVCIRAFGFLCLFSSGFLWIANGV